MYAIIEQSSLIKNSICFEPSSDQSSAQLLALNSQLRLLKDRYWQLTGLERVTESKERQHSSGEGGGGGGRCYPRKQGLNQQSWSYSNMRFIDCLC